MCAKAIAAATGFSISGLLDEGAKTRERYPVEEIALSSIADHPGNAAYSMEDAEIELLAGSIRCDGLTDIPLVRKLDDGSFQMLSGHRRKAAYALLAKGDDTYARIPCRVIRDISDEQALVLLHTANYFVRELNVLERAAASRALGIEVERLRAEDPSLKGRRAADIKADIITANTGTPVSASTVKRQEATAKRIKERLVVGWAAEAAAGRLSDAAITALASLDATAQESILAQDAWREMGKKERTAFIQDAMCKLARCEHPETDAPARKENPDKRLARADRELKSFIESGAAVASKADAETVESLARSIDMLRRRVSEVEGKAPDPSGAEGSK